MEGGDYFPLQLQVLSFPINNLAFRIIKKTKPTPTNPKLKNPLHDLDAQSCFRRLAFSETQELGFRQGSVQQVQVPNLNYVTWRQKWCSQACGHISLLQDFTIAL